MPTVLVVDDEIRFCRALGRWIEATDARYRVIGEAYDGEEALEKIAELKPDVLFTDIRMQVMDGLQLIAETKRRYAGLIPVIVSSYDDFDYTRRAIRLHAEDYLLKPLREEDLREVLERVAAKLDDAEQRRDTDWLQEMLDQGEPLQGQLIPGGLNYASYALSLWCAGPYCVSPDDALHPGKAFWTSAPWAASLPEPQTGRLGWWVLEGERANERLLLVGTNGRAGEASQAVDGDIAERASNVGACTDAARFHAEASSYAEAASHALLAHAASGRMPLTVVAGSLQGLGELRRIAQELRSRLPLAAGIGRSGFGSRSERGRAEAPRDDYRRLAQAVLRRQPEAMRAELERLTQIWEAESATQLRVDMLLRKTLYDLKEHWPTFRDETFILANQELDTLLSHSLDYIELREGAASLFAELMKLSEVKDVSVEARLSAHQEDTVARIEQYLRAHYASSITLQQLSRQFGLVPNYLSAIFKKARGVTPGEYVTVWRVQQAKSLMANSPELLLKDIADRVGYADPLYFSRVFKKVTGQSPSEFMK
ncbi:response regulator [Paenibacillus oryzisoli]|uniref:response regulator transcription factor n=1 Tax=Paenibacillus oryzisoli TaxID=1850517 RepID=UPI003D2D21B9